MPPRPRCWGRNRVPGRRGPRASWRAACLATAAGHWAGVRCGRTAEPWDRPAGGHRAATARRWAPSGVARFAGQRDPADPAGPGPPIHPAQRRPARRRARLRRARASRASSRRRAQVGDDVAHAALAEHRGASFVAASSVPARAAVKGAAGPPSSPSSAHRSDNCWHDAPSSWLENNQLTVAASTPPLSGRCSESVSASEPAPGVHVRTPSLLISTAPGTLPAPCTSPGTVRALLPAAPSNDSVVHVRRRRRVRRSGTTR